MMYNVHGILIDFHCFDSFYIVLRCTCFRTHHWCYFIKDYIAVEFDLPNGTIHQSISFRVCVIPNKHVFGVFGFEVCSCLGWVPSITYVTKDLKMANFRFLPTLSFLWCVAINCFVRTPHLQVHSRVDGFSLILCTNTFLMKLTRSQVPW